MYKFRCELRQDIPLPPTYTFPQAFNYLNPKTNSYYILERNENEYIQCGGSKARCTVEVRLAGAANMYTLYTIGHREGPCEETHVPMSNGGVYVQQREVLTHWEAIQLFTAFFQSVPFPEQYTLRRIDTWPKPSAAAKDA